VSATLQRRARMFWLAARRYPFGNTVANRAATTPAMRARAEGYEAACHACEQAAGVWRFTLPQ
jgi:hypothetical protein